MFEKGLLNFKERLVLIIPIVIVLAILAFFIKDVDKSEYYEKYLSQEEFNGKIVKKFNDYHNHGVEKLHILESNKQVKELYCDEWLELWSYCIIGDSLYKINGERKLHLYRTSTKDTIELDYNQIRESGFLKYRFDNEKLK